jgi:hypothetical protein
MCNSKRNLRFRQLYIEIIQDSFPTGHIKTQYFFSHSFLTTITWSITRAIFALFRKENPVRF